MRFRQGDKTRQRVVLHIGRKNLSERVFPLVANRLTRPGSEHALAGWLDQTTVAEGRKHAFVRKVG